jgi:hypothetical protein
MVGDCVYVWGENRDVGLVAVGTLCAGPLSVLCGVHLRSRCSAHRQYRRFTEAYS